jgi:hypothetical protein
VSGMPLAVAGLGGGGFWLIAGPGTDGVHPLRVTLWAGRCEPSPEIAGESARLAPASRRASGQSACHRVHNQSHRRTDRLKAGVRTAHAAPAGRPRRPERSGPRVQPSRHWPPRAPGRDFMRGRWRGVSAVLSAPPDRR